MIETACSVCGCLTRFKVNGAIESPKSWVLRMRGHYRDYPNCFEKLRATPFLKFIKPEKKPVVVFDNIVWPKEVLVPGRDIAFYYENKQPAIIFNRRSMRTG